MARDERKQLRRQNTAQQNFQPKTPSGIMQNSRLQQTVEAAVRVPTKSPPRPTGWEPLG